MDAISAEAKRLLGDRRRTLLRLAGPEPETGAPNPGRAPQQRLRESHRRDVAQIDAALVRIEAGTYGECERCGHAIGRQRLRAIPEARLCVTCTSGATEER